MQPLLRLLLLLAFAAPACPVPASAQPGFEDLGRSMLSGAGAALAPRPFFGAAAGVGYDRVTLSVTRLYGIGELHPARLSAERRLGRVVSLAMDLETLGLEGYSRHAATLSVGLGGRGTGVRAALRVLRVRAGRYAPVHAMTPAIVVRTPVVPALTVGLRVEAPPDAGSGDRNRLVSFGVAWSVEQDLSVSVDRVRRAPYRPGTAVGIAWDTDSVRLLAGWSSGPPTRSLGLVLRTGRLELGFLASFHDPLGWTTGIGMEWQ